LLQIKSVIIDFEAYCTLIIAKQLIQVRSITFELSMHHHHHLSLMSTNHKERDKLVRPIRFVGVSLFCSWYIWFYFSAKASRLL